MKKVLIVLFLIGKLSYAQEKCHTRLFLSSKEITEATKDTIFMKSFRRSPTFTHNIIVTDAKKSIKEYADQDVWGYQEHEFMKGCVIYRNYDYDFYRVRQIGSLIIYSKIFYKDLSVKRTKDMAHYSVYYFSKTLDSPIYLLRGENIKAAFSNNTCFLEKLNKGLKWNEDCTAYDRKNDSYKIVELYDACK